MARERGNPEVARSFRALGGYAEKKTDLWYALNALRLERGEPEVLEVEPGGHPDYTVLVPPYGFFVEVKSADRNFRLADLAPRQREWLDAFSDISWLWLFMGTTISARESPRRAWLVPWRRWLVVETRLAACGLRGLAYSTPHRRAHRTQGLSAETLLRRFALEWTGAGVWAIPPTHAFWRAPQRLAARFRPPRRPLSR